MILRALRGAVWRVPGLPRAARRARETIAAFHARRQNARHRQALPRGVPPVPPGRFLYRVAGTADIGWFIESGARAASSIRRALAEIDSPLEGKTAILDFGCGCGRVIRHWTGLPGRVHGSDLAGGPIRWCRRHLPFTFTANELDPPLRFEDDAFDLVYALSVFTHLDVPRQGAWMAEMHRVLRPGGHLLLTTHGQAYEERLPPELAARFRAGELVVTGDREAGSNVCSAFHPERYVREVLAVGWEIALFWPEGAAGNPPQDLWVLAKPRGCLL